MNGFQSCLRGEGIIRYMDFQKLEVPGDRQQRLSTIQGGKPSAFLTIG
jgi:hypothetical protein